MKTYHIIIQGRVQGVGFRYFVLRKALNLELKGTVENHPNGDIVEIYCQGKENDVQKLFEEINTGPALATVIKSNIETTDYPPYNDFKII